MHLVSERSVAIHCARARCDEEYPLRAHSTRRLEQEPRSMRPGRNFKFVQKKDQTVQPAVSAFGGHNAGCHASHQSAKHSASVAGRRSAKLNVVISTCIVVRG